MKFLRGICSHTGAWCESPARKLPLMRPTAPPRAPVFEARTEPLMDREEGPLRKMAPDWLPLLLASTEPSKSTLDEPLMYTAPACPCVFCWNVLHSTQTNMCVCISCSLRVSQCLHSYRVARLGHKPSLHKLKDMCQLLLSFQSDSGTLGTSLGAYIKHGITPA